MYHSGAAPRRTQPSAPAKPFQDLVVPEHWQKFCFALDAAIRTSQQEVEKWERQAKEEARKNEVLRQQNDQMLAEIAKLKAQLQHKGPAAFGDAGPGACFQPPERLAVAPSSCFKAAKTFTYHQSPVQSVAIKNDTIATASWDTTVKLFSPDGGQPRTLGDNKAMGGLYCAAFAKTSSSVLGCTSCDHKAYLWNYQKGELLRGLTGHQGEVNGLDFHENQNVMCTASDDKTAMIWDFQEMIQLRTLTEHNAEVYSATFLGGGDQQYLVATCCFDKCTRVFDMRDKKVTQCLRGPEDDVIGLATSPQHNILATGSDDGVIFIYDTRKWSQLKKIDTKLRYGGAAQASPNEVKRIAFSPDGKMLAAAGSCKSVLVYSNDNGNWPFLEELSGHTECVFDVAWGNVGNDMILVSASHDHSSKSWIYSERFDATLQSNMGFNRPPGSLRA